MRCAHAVLGLLAMGCASDAAFDSGVPNDVQLDEVSTAQAMTFCVALDAYLQMSFSPAVEGDFNCHIQALQTEPTPAGCQTAVDACLAAPPSAPLDIMPIDCTFAGPEPTCHATIGELEHCLAAEVDSYLAWLAQADCANAGNAAALNGLSRAPLTPEECTRLRERCPVYAGGFFD